MLETDVRYAGYRAAARAVCEEIGAGSQAIPGVEAAALLRRPADASDGACRSSSRAPRRKPESRVAGGMIGAGPGFFETLRIPLLYGRAFDERDRADTPRVAVISETHGARSIFGTANAVGRRFRLENDPGAWTEVIGVARDTGTGDLGERPPRSGPAAVLPIVHAVRALRRRSSRGRRSMRRPSSRRCSASCARSTPRCRSCRPGRWRSIWRTRWWHQGDRDVSRRPRRARPAARRHRPLRRRRLCRRAALARNRHPHGARRAQSAGGLERGTRRGGARRRRHRAHPLGARDARPRASSPLPNPPRPPCTAQTTRWRCCHRAVMVAVGVAAAFLPARRAARMDPLVALRRD